MLRVLRLMLTDKLAVAELMRQRYGGIAEIALGPLNIVLVGDRDNALKILRDNDIFAEKGLGLREARYFLGDGMLTAAGEVWRNARCGLTAWFRSDRLDRPLTTCASTVDDAVRVLALRPRGKPVDIQPFAARIALKTIGSMVFGAHHHEYTAQLLADFTTLGRWVEGRLVLPLDAVTWTAWHASRRCRRALARLRSICAAIIGDDPDGSHVDQILTLLFAGQETTSAALCWTLDLLSRHPYAAQRVADEAHAVFAAEMPPTRTIENLKVTRAAVKEALRLHPPVWVLPRRAARATTVNGYSIAAGSEVLINIYGIHRDPRQWREPNRFEPNRFLDLQADPADYMPFGIGARQCLGRHLGLAEITLTVAKIVARFKLTPATETTPTLAGLTLRPRNGVPLYLTARR